MSDSMTNGLKGLVLAGGKSTRLGLDKAGVDMRGMSLLARTVHLARVCCTEVHVSGRDPAAMELSTPWLPDDVPGVGPMGGILTGLRKLGGPLLVLACDMPMLDLETIERLVDARNQGQERGQGQAVTFYQQVETGYVESLVAIYESRAAELLQTALERGQYSLSKALPETERRHVPYSQDQAEPFFNVNYPAELALLKKIQRLDPEGGSMERGERLVECVGERA